MFGFIPSIVSKLFGNKKQKEVTTTQTTRNEVDYVKLRENAEAGGFNPEFALANGGAAGHTVSHVPFTRMMGGGRNIIGHALDAVNDTTKGVMSAVGMGGGMPSGGFTSAFDYDPLQQQKSGLEMQLMQSQLHRLNGGVSYAKGMGAPMATGSRYSSNSKVMGAGLSTLPKPRPNHDHSWIERKDRPWYPIEKGGFMTTNPWMAPGQVIEDEYTELLSYPYSLLKFGVDLGYSSYIAQRRIMGDAVRAGNASGKHHTTQPVTPRPKAPKPSYYRKDAQGYLRKYAY